MADSGLIKNQPNGVEGVKVDVTVIEENLKQIEAQIDRILSVRGRAIIAIEGCCAAGKTTLAEKIGSLQKHKCNIFHMDDFFLKPSQRTVARLSEAGGNVDYERFYNEVVLPVVEAKNFVYRPYSCSKGGFLKPIDVAPRQLNIIEGTYSTHPFFGVYYDFAIFIKISDNLQRERILKRNKALYRRFFEEWIPMEQVYFKKTNAADRCDMIIDTIL